MTADPLRAALAKRQALTLEGDPTADQVKAMLRRAAPQPPEAAPPPLGAGDRALGAAVRRKPSGPTTDPRQAWADAQRRNRL